MAVPLDYFLFKMRVLKKSFVITLLLSFAAFLSGQKGFSSGAAVGGLISIAVFLLLYKYVLCLRGVSRARRKNFLIPRALFIYILVGLTLFIAINLF